LATRRSLPNISAQRPMQSSPLHSFCVCTPHPSIFSARAAGSIVPRRKRPYALRSPRSRAAGRSRPGSKRWLNDFGPVNCRRNWQRDRPACWFAPTSRALSGALSTRRCAPATSPPSGCCYRWARSSRRMRSTSAALQPSIFPPDCGSKDAQKPRGSPTTRTPGLNAPRSRLFRSTMSQPPKLMMRCRSHRSRAVAGGSASTSQRPRSHWHMIRRSICSRASACPRCTCPATKSPCSLIRGRALFARCGA